MTPAEIAKGRELLAKSTPKPWRREHPTERGQDYIVGVNYDAPDTYDEPVVTCDSGVYGPRPPDADLIVFAVNSLAGLLDEVERLRAEAARLARTDVVGPFAALTSSMCVGGNHPLKAGECWCGKYRVTERTGAVLTEEAKP